MTHGQKQIIPELVAAMCALDRENYHADPLRYVRLWVLAAGGEAEALALAERFLPQERTDGELPSQALTDSFRALFVLRVGAKLRESATPGGTDPTALARIPRAWSDAWRGVPMTCSEQMRRTPTCCSKRTPICCVSPCGMIGNRPAFCPSFSSSTIGGASLIVVKERQRERPNSSGWKLRSTQHPRSGFGVSGRARSCRGRRARSRSDRSAPRPASCDTRSTSCTHATISAVARCFMSPRWDRREPSARGLKHRATPENPRSAVAAAASWDRQA